MMSMVNLASTYQRQGRLQKAERLEVQVMETRMMEAESEARGVFKNTQFRASGDSLPRRRYDQY